ncbi:hypothetical protein AB0G04_08400 [Actinoplanes sp. NPDC023801]|uniref:hypothetical protein n=1 Tax=Actinoplanes sp. NPDC023801 TaxID=3154595 RepID=UPI0033C33B19
MTDEVVCRDINGTLQRVRLDDRAACSTPGSMLHQRLVTGPGDVPYLRKSVPAEAGRRNPALYDLLDNEIRAVAQLTRVFGGRSGEVPSLIGYNVDVDEPFVLLRPYVGRPAPDTVRGLDQDGRRKFQIGLLRALHLTGEAGVVHGALRLEALRWNGTIAQLVDFEWAQRSGDRRRAGSGPRQSPERLAGHGTADPRDDVWSAGVLIRELVLGGQALTAPADQSNDPVRLRERLHGVFQPVAERPAAAELLRRMHAPAPPVPRPVVTAGLDDGYRMFDDACRRKGGAAHDAADGTPAPANGRRGLRRLLSGGLTARTETR